MNLFDVTELKKTLYYVYFTTITRQKKQTSSIQGPSTEWAGLCQCNIGHVCIWHDPKYLSVQASWVLLLSVRWQRMGEGHMDALSAESGGCGIWDSLLEWSHPIAVVFLPFGYPVAQPFLT